MDNQQALLSLMQGKYADIREIETRYQIFGHEGDYRSRIEYYHDAVRALHSDYEDGLSKHSRLSVERLAYDAEMLRIITARPLVAGRGEQHFSTSDAISADGMAGSNLRPDRRTKQELTQLYRDYTVFFVAIMMPKADENNTARKEESDILIEDCYRLENLLNQLSSGSLDIGAVVKAANMMEHEGLRQKIMMLLNNGIPSKGELTQASQSVQQARHSVQHDVQAMDAAAMRFSSSQLMVYEESRDTVKKLASQGLNIAGKHTGTAIQQQHSGQSRGV